MGQSLMAEESKISSFYMVDYMIYKNELYLGLIA